MRLPFRRPAGPVTHDRSKSRGQSLTEFALFLPVLLLLVLVALDFGRIYLGWINLQQMARVAANYAADNASAWNPLTIDTAKQARYEELIENDARKSVGCVPQDPLPDPVFVMGTGLGAQVTVTINCEFTLLTPGIQAILGPSIYATGSATFPVKEGVVAAVPGGGAPIGIAPVARFDVSPRTGWSALEVTFTDTSLNDPTGWSWDFVVSPTTTGTGVGSVSDGVSSAAGPHTITYTCTGVAGDTCTWGVSLSVSNPAGTSSQQLDDWITVTVPPDTGPIAEFTGTPRSGIDPVTVDFEFVDLRNGAVTYTSWDWDFGDGFTGSGETVTHTYEDDGTYDVTLTVSDGTTDSALTKVAYIIVSRPICTVPDFGNTRLNQAQRLWEDAGFATTITTLPGPNNYAIQYQSIVGGTVDPHPDGCDSAITVGPAQP
jgi:PKD repeat protein